MSRAESITAHTRELEELIRRRVRELTGCDDCAVAILEFDGGYWYATLYNASALWIAEIKAWGWEGLCQALDYYNVSDECDTETHRTLTYVFYRGCRWAYRDDNEFAEFCANISDAEAGVVECGGNET